MLVQAEATVAGLDGNRLGGNEEVWRREKAPFRL